MAEGKQLGRIDRDTLMPLGVVVSLLAGAWWIGTRMSDVQHEVSLLRRDLAQMQASSSEALTKRELRAWVELLRARNPAIAVPELPGP